VCLSNLHQSILAIHTYANTSKEVVPRGGTNRDLHWTCIVARELKQIPRLPLHPSQPNTYVINSMRVDRMEIFHCPERSTRLNPRFMDYLVNAISETGEGEIVHTSPQNRAQCLISSFKYPAQVFYIADVERELPNATVANSCTLAQMRTNFHEAHRAYEATGNLDVFLNTLAIDCMDVWMGNMLPQGYNGVNTPGGAAPRRMALQMHLNRFTNAAFYDGHAGGIPAANYKNINGQPDHKRNYIYWLRLAGVEDPEEAATSFPPERGS